MRTYCFIIMLMFFLYSCKNSTSDEFKITGTIEGSTNQPVNLYLLSTDNRYLLDSVQTNSEGFFKISGTIEKPGFAELEFGDNSQIFLIIKGKDNINIKGNKQTINSAYQISGSYDSELLKNLIIEQNLAMEKLSSLLTIYRDSIENRLSSPDSLIIRRNLKREAIIDNYREFSRQFVRENKESLASIMALYQFIDPYTPVLSPDDDLEYFAMADSALAPLHPNVDAVKELNRLVIQKQEEVKLLSEGSFAPEIALPDTAGNLVTLSTLSPNYVLVDFWASWCKPCLKENKALLNTYNEFKDKGFEIFQVSLDKSETAWENAILEDSLPWVNVSDLQMWNSVVVPAYRIEAIPANYLVSPEGIIVGKNLFGPQLHKKLNDIFTSKNN